MKQWLLGFLLLLVFGLLAACSSDDKEVPAGHGHGVYMLIDTSGTYTQELEKARREHPDIPIQQSDYLGMHESIPEILLNLASKPVD